MRLPGLIETFPLRPYIAPAMRGTVVDGARPVAGAALARTWRWTWGNQDGAEAATTAADGTFALPAIRRWMLLGAFLPHEPVLRHELVVTVGGRAWTAWSSSSHTYERDLGLGRPLVLTCRLDSEPRRRDLDRLGIHTAYGIADIEGIP